MISSLGKTVACFAWLLPLFSASCRAPDPRGSDAARPAGPAGQGPVNPAFANLPEVNSTAVAPDARGHLDVGRKDLERVLQSAETDGERAAAWGRFGELTHAYGLAQLALPSYLRALELTKSAKEREFRTGGAESWRWEYLLAVLRQQAGELEDASGHLAELLKRRPNDLAARLRLAEIRLAQGENDKAATLYRQLLEREATRAAAHFGLGRIASTAGRHPEAIEHWLNVLKQQPEAKNVHSLLASAYRRVGDEEAARFHSAQIGTGFVTVEDPVLEAMKGKANGVGALIEDAMRAVEKEDWQRALGAYETALKTDPTNVSALGGKAFMQRMLRSPAQAEATYRLLLELHPEHTLHRLELGTLLSESPESERENLQEAVEQLRTVLQAEPDFEQAHTNLGVAYSKLGDWQRSVIAFEKALELDPDDPRTRHRYAVALETSGRTSDAIQILRRLVADVPTHVPAHQRLGHHLEQAGDLEGSARMYRRVLEIEGTPPQEQALAHYQLGRLASRPGTPNFDAEAAQRHFERAVDLFPRLWQARFALGRRFSEQGRWADAAEQYAAIVADQPTQVEPRALEAEARMRAGQWQRAAAVLDRGLEIAPQAAQLGHLMARLQAIAPAGLRDPGRALALARSVFEAHPSMLHTETVVMALAAQGRFEEAVQWQERLVSKAETDGEPELLPRLRANLERYLQGLPPSLDG